MATATSYGSITIVDITDIGEFSVYPKCNLPTTVIYSPDSNNYTPNWSSNNLVITPVAYYAGAPQTTNITWTWERQEGLTGSRTTVVSGQNGESIGSNGALTVSANKFPAGSNYSQLTYYVTATYPNSASSLGRDLVAEGQITFSKVEQGTSAKTARISGDNIFKYNTNDAIVGNSSITLTGTVTNCSISSWQYYNTSTSAWATYPNSSSSATLTVSESDSTFSGDRVRIKLVTNDNNTYDEFTIYKLRDGAAGTSVISAVLTNEDQMIAANSSGTPISYAGATSTIRVLMGGTDITSDATITITADSGIGYTASKATGHSGYTSNDTVTVTSMGNSISAGNIYFQCTGYAQRDDLNANTYVANRYYTKSGNNYVLATGAYNTNTTYYEYYDITKAFSLVKVQAGADAQTFYIYDLVLDTVVLNRSAGNSPTYTPASFTASATKTTVSTSSATTVAWSGKFRITEYYPASVTTNNPNVTYTSSTTESSKTYTPSGPTVTKILVELLDTAGSNVLDSQTIVIADDGATGAQGPQGNPGADAVSILLGNEAEIISCTNANYPVNQTVITIPFGAYKGTTRVAATVNSPQLFGVTPVNTSANASSDGSLVYTIPTSTLISDSSGKITLTFTCQGQTYYKVFSWARSSAAVNGIDGVTMLIFTPDGTLFDNGTGELELTGYLQSGSTDVTNSATWKWYQWDSSLPNPAYVELPTSSSGNDAYYSGKTATVKADAIDGYGSFKVEAQYSGKTYTQYISLTDKTDPIQISVHSTIGTQIVNGQGAGAIYARVTRNGEEIDPIGDTEVTTGITVPSGTASAGAHYIYLNTTNKTATLYIYDTSWTVQPIEATYEWTFRNKDNTPITDSAVLTTKFGSAYNSTTNKVTGKCIFVNATTVDNKITADVKVTV